MSVYGEVYCIFQLFECFWRGLLYIAVVWVFMERFTVYFSCLSVFGEVYCIFQLFECLWRGLLYISDKGCVRHCVENMQRAQDLSPLDLVEMFVTVFCFLKDSSEVSHVLLDDFKSCQGYTYLSEFILRYNMKNYWEIFFRASLNFVNFFCHLTQNSNVNKKNF